MVLPATTFLGTWRTALVAREGDLLPLPPSLVSPPGMAAVAGGGSGSGTTVGMPLEVLAMCRELCVAYRLLEAHGDLKVWFCVWGGRGATGMAWHGMACYDARH